MRFRRFVIENYRAITGPLEVDVAKHSLVPVIGINEAGKTTILHAIFAFDSANDKLNDGGRHLLDTANLYRTSSPPPTISAVLDVDVDELRETLDGLATEGFAATAKRYLRKRRQFPSVLKLTRNLRTLRYSIDAELFNDTAFNHDFAEALIGQLPYILFFDDFRDSIDEKIEIVGDGKRGPTGWLAILEQLFKRTDPSFSVFKLADLEDRQRKSVLAKVKKHLNRTLTREWQNFRLDDSNALEISIEYERVTEATPRDFLKLEIIEKDAEGDAHYFFIRDRSKGFFWFFNFVMKLEFNPKIIDGTDCDAVYLLDEPGSYLHASAQSKLCSKLRHLSETNRVIYCTHSHYLLDPSVIPLATIRVADKDANGNIQLVPIHEHQGNIRERRSAFQPVVDALQIKPFLLDLTTQMAILTEGIFDYYCIEMFKHNRPVNALPNVGAPSVRYFVSLLIAWRVQFCALWDNDDAGRQARAEAEATFGEEIAARHFFLIPSDTRKKRIMQDLFAGEDMVMFRMRLDLPKQSSFEKVIAALYYAPLRTEILNDVSTKTRENFEELFASILRQ